MNPSYRSLDGVLVDGEGTLLLQFPGGRGGDYVVPDGVTGIGDYAFAYAYGLSSVVIPDGVTSLGDRGFTFCDNLSKVTIGNGVTDIRAQTFSYCPKLREIRIGKSVGSIGGLALAGCSELRSVVIPASVTSLGISAFSGCSSLTSVFFEGDAPLVIGSAFGGTTGAVVYRLPEATGWDKLFSYRTPHLWLPQVITDDSGLGMGESGFGFDIFWADGREVQVESCDDVANPVWSSAGTVTVENGSARFTDPNPAAHPQRFYRLVGP